MSAPKEEERVSKAVGPMVRNCRKAGRLSIGNTCVEARERWVQNCLKYGIKGQGISAEGAMMKNCNGVESLMVRRGSWGTP